MIRKLLTVSFALLLTTGTAHAYQSTINPLLPVQNSPITSPPVRGNFQAAYNDINNIYSLLPGTVGTVTTVSCTNAHGVTCTSSGGTSPALTFTLGAITPTSVTASGAGSFGSTLTVGGNTSIAGSLTTNITGATQCLRVNSGGVISGTGSDCGAGSGGGVTTFSAGTTGFTPSSPASGDVVLSGVLSVANGGTGNGAFTQGSVIFASTSGIFSQNNAHFFWDNTNVRLGIGTATPSTALVVIGTTTSTTFAGAGTGLTGTAASLTAGTVTTNANLTGPITSTGNATSIASQTGTGSTFAMSASPAFTGTVTGVNEALTGTFTAVGSAAIGTTSLGSGFLTIGTPSFSDTAGTTAIQATGNINNYYQEVIQNSNAGSSASADYIAGGNDMNATTHYLDLGKNGSAGGVAPFTSADASYLYTIDNELDLSSVVAGGTINLSAGATPTTEVSISTAGVALSQITGSTQCLHVNTSGVISGTGSDCGSGGGAVSITALDTSIVVSPSPITGTGTVAAGNFIKATTVEVAMNSFGGL